MFSGEHLHVWCNQTSNFLGQLGFFVVKDAICQILGAEISILAVAGVSIGDAVHLGTSAASGAGGAHGAGRAKP